MRYLLLFGFLCSCLTLFPGCSLFMGHIFPEKRVTETYAKKIESAQHLINDRRHGEALALLEDAGSLRPEQPEWLYESGRALFAMDRFSECASACQNAMDRDPAHYEAMALNWAARLEASHRSEEMKEQIGDEIRLLMANADHSPEALLAAYQGYKWMDNESAQQHVISRLAPLAEKTGPLIRESIAASLFEQIIKAREERSQQMDLMRAYIQHFPERRFVEYTIDKLLQLEWETTENPGDPMDFINTALPEVPEGKRVNMGIARWLIKEDQQPEKAIQLLKESIQIANTQPEKIPPYFDAALWQAEQKKEKNYMHYLLGRAFFNAGQMDQAFDELTYVADENKQCSGTYHYLGRIGESREKYDAAIGYYRKALEIDDRPADTETYLSNLLTEYRGYRAEPAKYFSRQTDTITFTDVTAAAGLAETPAKRVAWGDFNRDGFADLLLDGRMLFQNNRDGTFTDVSAAVGLKAVKRLNGGIWADYDNDGDPDIFIISHAENYLLENKGAGEFVNITDRAFGGPLSKKRTEAAAWGDMDNDGLLDLYVANYERSGVMRALGTPDQLFRNNGDGTFSEVTIKAGIRSDEAMCGRGVTWTDINADGRQDIVVANYRLDPNFLWINDREGGFTDKADFFNIRGNMTEGAFGHSIGPASGDLDNDGDLDLVIPNLAHPRYIQFSDKTMVLVNKGAPTFEFVNRYHESGLFFEETNSDPALADVDNDGDLDLYITSIYSGRNAHLYLNDGTGAFVDATWLSGTRIENGWGAAFADFNNDGFSDLMVASSDGVTLLRNNGNVNHWVKVAIDDSRCHRSGIGSIVRISYDGNTQMREMACGRGTGSQDGPAVIFGLGRYNGPVRINVRTLCGDQLETCVEGPDQTVLMQN